MRLLLSSNILRLKQSKLLYLLLVISSLERRVSIYLDWASWWLLAYSMRLRRAKWSCRKEFTRKGFD